MMKPTMPEIVNETCADIREDWIRSLERAVSQTYDLLEEVGHPYKALVKITLCSARDPYWKGSSRLAGEVCMNPFCHDIYSVAHEVAHGLHEKIAEERGYCGRDEEFEQAIRYYVGSEMGVDFRWRNEFEKDRKQGKDANSFTSRYSTFQEFSDALHSGKLFDEVSWGP